MPQFREVDIGCEGSDDKDALIAAIINPETTWLGPSAITSVAVKSIVLPTTNPIISQAFWLYLAYGLVINFYEDAIEPQIHV